MTSIAKSTESSERAALTHSNAPSRRQRMSRSQTETSQPQCTEGKPIRETSRRLPCALLDRHRPGEGHMIGEPWQRIIGLWNGRAAAELDLAASGGS
jgi:hypothetical protein